MKADPSYADEVRMDAGAFKPKGHLKKKEDASEFVEWADDVTNEYVLQGYWKMNEGSGTTVTDSSGEGNDGTIDGASWITMLEI